MKINNNFLCLIFGILFLSCVSQNHNTNTSKSYSSNKNIPNDIVFYTLSKGETLSEFIENQNKMNDYAKYENVPTDQDIRDKFVFYEKLVKEYLSKLSEEDIKEFGTVFSEISIEEFFKLNFLYTIYYNKNNRVWHIKLIGRSTTLFLEYSSNRDYVYKNDLRYYNNLIPYINRWMDLNKIPSLESSIRININDDLDDVIIELYGISF